MLAGSLESFFREDWKILPANAQIIGSVRARPSRRRAAIRQWRANPDRAIGRVTSISGYTLRMISI